MPLAISRRPGRNGKGLPGHDNLEQYLRGGVVDRDQAIVQRGPNGPVAEGQSIAPALEAALASAKSTFKATYYWPCQSHASLAPSCAVADVRGDTATVWTSSQVTYGLRATLARVFGLPAEKMRVVFMEGSGSYGTNGADHAAADALLVSKTIGKPVRVQWSRQDEHVWDPKGPQQLLDLRAGVDEQRSADRLGYTDVDSDQSARRANSSGGAIRRYRPGQRT